MELSPNSDLVGRDSVEPREGGRLPQRRHPAKGVFIFPDKATIVFVTVCSRQRKKRLASTTVHNGLLQAWRIADSWMIGAYVIIPDHIHFFCSPKDEGVEIENGSRFGNVNSAVRV